MLRSWRSGFWSLAQAQAAAAARQQNEAKLTKFKQVLSVGEKVGVTLVEGLVVLCGSVGRVTDYERNGERGNGKDAASGWSRERISETGKGVEGWEGGVAGGQEGSECVLSVQEWWAERGGWARRDWKRQREGSNSGRKRTGLRARVGVERMARARGAVRRSEVRSMMRREEGDE